MENFLYLLKKFYEIKEKGYIVSKYNDLGFAGKTFENLLGLRLNSNKAPDFKDIEIKVKSNKSDYPISLFSVLPLSLNKKCRPVINYLFFNYSFHDAFNNEVFSCIVTGNEYTLCNNSFSFKLKVDFKTRKIFLIIKKDNLIVNNDIFWYFSQFEKSLLNKLNKLAIVDANLRNVDGIKYCYYYNINFYCLRDTDTFFKLLDSGIISVNFNIRIKDNFIISDGVKFGIKYENIEKLFIKFY